MNEDHAREKEIAQIKSELSRSNDPKYRLRLEAIILILQGQNSSEAARVLKLPRRTVQDWFKRFRDGGLEALKSGHRGRPTKIAPEDIEEIRRVIEEEPERIVGKKLTGEDVVAILTTFYRNKKRIMPPEFSARACRRYIKEYGLDKIAIKQKKGVRKPRGPSC